MTICCHFFLFRSLKCGFCQLHFPSPSPTSAFTVNASRPEEERLPEDAAEAVVSVMAERMEPPEPGKNAWERFSFTVALLGKDGARVEVGI